MTLIIEYGGWALALVVGLIVVGAMLAHEKKPKRPAHQAFGDEYE